MQPSVVGLITARGGSKSIPQKNIVLVAGKPLIAWTIETALQSPSLSRVIVSTDDEEIAEVSRQWGADVPFMRPQELAQDDSSHISVAAHALNWLESQDKSRPDYLMLLQPTSPFRTVEDIEGSIGVAHERKADSVVSVCDAHCHPYRMKRVAEDGTLSDFIANVPLPGSMLIRRQALPSVFYVNGAIFMGRPEVLLRHQTFLPPGTIRYVMPPERSLEVDEPWELHLARLVMEEKHGSRNH